MSREHAVVRHRSVAHSCIAASGTGGLRAARPALGLSGLLASLLALGLCACSVDARPSDPLSDGAGSGGAAGSGGTAGSGGVPAAPDPDAGQPEPPGAGGDASTPQLPDPQQPDPNLPNDVNCDGGTCPPQVLPCDGCLIDGVCEAGGSTRPGNACEGCDPALASDAWSPLEGGCDDGLFCTENDSCQAGVCSGTPRNCEDGAACNGVSVCDEEAQTCSTPASTCDSDEFCDVDTDTCILDCDGCVIDGSCVGSGVTAPGNPCLICDPGRSTVNYSPNAAVACGSGPSECSGQDTCDGSGNCQPNDAADGSACGTGGALFCVDGSCRACDDTPNPDDACESRDDDAPLCNSATGRCVACLASTCGGSTPRCEPSVGCVACTEHSHCPGTACHLSGPLQGSCFEQGDTVQVSTAAALETQLNALVPGRPTAIRLAANNFATTEFLDVQGDGTEVALIGTSGTVLSGGPTNGTPFLLNAGFDTILYVASLSITTGPSSAVGTSSDSIVWLDDVNISGYPNNALSGAGEGHVRRSRLRSTGTAIRWAAGALFMENTALGSGGNTGLQTLNSPRIDVTYSTIVGQTSALACDASPGPSGQIRNSILIGTGNPPILGSACELLSYTGNAVNQTGFGTVVGGFDPAWFSSASTGDMHLTGQGAAAIGNLATRGAGDPAVDIDGQARPTSGRPGVDQR